MLRVGIDLPAERDALYREALRRIRDVETVDSGPEAIIGTSANTDVPVLLDQPELRNPDEVSGNVMPAHLWRFLPTIRPVRACQKDGKLGEPGLLRIHHWLAKPVPLAQAAFPQVDLAQWFFGRKAEVAQVISRADYMQLHLGFYGDGMAVIDIASDRPGNASYHSMHLIGSEGAAYADDHRNAQLCYSDDGARALVFGQNRLQGIQRMLEEFFDGIRERRDWSVGWEDTERALETLEVVGDA